MKKIFAPFLLLFAFSILLNSCQKEDIEPPKELAMKTELQDDLGPLAMMGPFTSDVAAVTPDLAITTALTTNIIPLTNNCGAGTLLPNVSCFGGQRNFIITAVIRNIGLGTVPAGVMEVRWVNSNTGGTFNFIQLVPHAAIPGGGTITAARPYWMGPCGCVPPPTSFNHKFAAFVDPNNLITETNESNNLSPTFLACDGC